MPWLCARQQHATQWTLWKAMLVLIKKNSVHQPTINTGGGSCVNTTPRTLFSTCTLASCRNHIFTNSIRQYPLISCLYRLCHLYHLYHPLCLLYLSEGYHNWALRGGVTCTNWILIRSGLLVSRQNYTTTHWVARFSSFQMHFLPLNPNH